mmetsp:Transcript_61310/g.138799  ORF Transcript_61310/g.138799 Transcript_61310/m.138799 type:complete len:766 (-) Transcript_61310:59-2356(-)
MEENPADVERVPVQVVEDEHQPPTGRQCSLASAGARSAVSSRGLSALTPAEGLSAMRPHPLVLPPHPKRQLGENGSPRRARGSHEGRRPSALLASTSSDKARRNDIRFGTYGGGVGTDSKRLEFDPPNDVASEHVHGEYRKSEQMHGEYRKLSGRMDYEMRMHLASIESKLDVMNVRLECMMTEKQKKMPVKQVAVPLPTGHMAGAHTSLELLHWSSNPYSSEDGDKGDRISSPTSKRPSVTSTVSAWNQVGPSFIMMPPPPSPLTPHTSTGRKHVKISDGDELRSPADSVEVSPPASPSAMALRSQSAVSMMSGASFLGRFSSHGRVFNRRNIAIWNFLQDSDSSNGAKWYARIMTGIILVSVIVTMLQTLGSPNVKEWSAAILETALELIFVSDILLRLAVCPSRRTFLHDPYNVIDIMSTVPLLFRASVGLLLPAEEGRFHAVRLILLYIVPLLRLLKTLRRFETFHLLLEAFTNCVEALPILIFTLLVIMLTFASAIYIVEPRDNIDNYPTALWFTIVTMTTVGYGDVVPKSTAGFIIVACLVVTSLLYLAMPVGIIGQSFTRIWQDRHRILLTWKTRRRLEQWGYTAADVPRLFQNFGISGTGLLNFFQFRKMLRKMKVGLADDRMRALFDLVDNDRSGWIDVKEFVETVFPQEYHTSLWQPRVNNGDVNFSPPGSPTSPRMQKVDVNVTRPASERWNDDDDDDAEADPLSLPPFRADGDEERNWNADAVPRKSLKSDPDISGGSTTCPTPLMVLPSSMS